MSDRSSDRRRRFAGLKDIIQDNVRQGLSAGLTALGDLVKPAKQLLEDDPIITLQCGKVVMENTPRMMRTELWMSSLHRKGVGVAAAEQYEDMLMHKSISEEAASDIDKDLARTFPSMRRFAFQEGQEALRRVLLAYAAYDPEVGYCQGMNFVAGLLLMYLPERHAFGGLVVLMQDRGLRKYYSTDMSLLQTHLWQLGRLMPQKLCSHLEACGVLPLLYGASWLMTCFSADFPASFSARVMDVIMADKMDQALLKAALGLLKSCEMRLLQLRDMEDILQLLKLQLPNWEEPLLHDVLTDAFKTTWSAQQLQLLGSTEGAESVAEALERVQRANNQGTEPAAEARAGRISTAGSTGADSVDGLRGDGSGGGSAAATAIRLTPPPSPRPLSKHLTQRGLVVEQGHGLDQGPGSKQSPGLNLADLLGSEHTLDYPALRGSSIGAAGEARAQSQGAGLPVLTVAGRSAAADLAAGNLFLIDMSSPRASSNGRAAEASAAEAADAGGLPRGGSDWAAFVEAPAPAPAVPIGDAADWDPFSIPPSSSSASSNLPATAPAAVGQASARASPNSSAIGSSSNDSRRQVHCVQMHRQQEQQIDKGHSSKQQISQQQQQQQHRTEHHGLRQQVEVLSFTQLSSGPGQSTHQQQQQQQQELHHWQPSLQQSNGSNVPVAQATSPQQVTADDDWWNFQSSPVGRRDGDPPKQQQHL